MFVLTHRGSTELVYDTGEGSISEMMATKTLNSKSDESWQCKEGFTISVEVKFSKASFSYGGSKNNV